MDRLAPLSILLTNLSLATYAGTEVVVRDLAFGLRRRGHRPIAFSPMVGCMAADLVSNGIPVVDDLGKIQESPDLIHAHHTIPCGEALIRFPDVPAINVCHAAEHWMEAPVLFPQIGTYVAVDEACRDRLLHTPGIDPSAVVVLGNGVDLTRIPPRPRPLPEQPLRAAAFGKAVKVAEARAACAAVGIEYTAIGGRPEELIAHPEHRLVEYDLVFASARAALEALCCGCAVIVCDERGMAGLVTTGMFASLRAQNFGLRSFVHAATAERLVQEVRRYDRHDAVEVCARARHEADVERLLDAFEALYAEVLTGTRRPSVSAEAQQRARTRFLHEHLPRSLFDTKGWWDQERRALQQRVDALEAELRESRRGYGAALTRQLSSWGSVLASKDQGHGTVRRRTD